MGLIKAALGAAGGILADQWKEYFICDAMDADVLVQKGRAKSGSRSSNKKETDNIITSGSVIVVNEGQCMMIVDQGKIVELAAEAGEYTFDASTEPTIFCGDLAEGVKASIAQFGKRFTFGGEAAKDQRVYYFNTRELMGNKYGTPNPVPFRVVDRNIGLDTDVNIRCFGEYSYRICDPVLFYKNVCGNVAGEFRRSDLDGQLKADLLGALGKAFSKVADMGIRYSALPGHAYEMAEAMNEVLSAKWRSQRGLEIVNFGVSSVKALEEDEARIKMLQTNAVLSRPGMAGAHLVNAQASAMKDAAGNSNGAMMGFMGMGMAQQAGGMNAGQLFQMAQQEPAPAAEGWKCGCGNVNTGKFCTECGAKKPEAGWKCACGSVNKGKFCPECGAKKPAKAPQYRCDKCGWEPADPTRAPRFCPECGDPFDAGDMV